MSKTLFLYEICHVRRCYINLPNHNLSNRHFSKFTICQITFFTESKIRWRTFFTNHRFPAICQNKNWHYQICYWSRDSSHSKKVDFLVKSFDDEQILIKKSFNESWIPQNKFLTNCDSADFYNTSQTSLLSN